MRYSINYALKCWVIILICSFFAYAKNHKKFILITSLYNETNPERCAEYIACLDKNLSHTAIKKIHVLYDTSKDDTSNSLLNYLIKKDISVTYIQDRPTFGFCFELANNLYPNSKIILTNGDIFFNGTLHQLDSYDLQNKFLALTRWDLKKDGSLVLLHHFYDNKFHKAYDSQDVWIFKTPMRKFNNDNIKLGTMTCDTLIAYQAHACGLTTLNPCLSVQACHLHLSEIRNYDQSQKVKGQPLKLLEWVRL